MIKIPVCFVHKSGQSLKIRDLNFNRCMQGSARKQRLPCMHAKGPFFANLDIDLDIEHHHHHEGFLYCLSPPD